MQWVEGKRLETVVDTVQPNEIAGLGESLGKTLSDIHSFHFEQQGFLMRISISSVRWKWAEKGFNPMSTNA